MAQTTIRYLDRKDAIREQLLACARTGRRTTYGELGAQVGIPVQGPWRGVLDALSREEMEANRPDITHLVIKVSTGMPGRVEYEDARPGDPTQRERLRSLQAECWAFHGAPQG